MSAIERATTEVRIGNHGKALAYVNTTNELIVKAALDEFNRGLFDCQGVKRYFNCDGVPCVMDSLRLAGCGIWASLQYPREFDEYVSEVMENKLRRGCLWLGADIEFDERKILHDPSILRYDTATIQAMAVGERMTAITFRMLYFWNEHHQRRDTIYKA